MQTTLLLHSYLVKCFNAAVYLNFEARIRYGRTQTFQSGIKKMTSPALCAYVGIVTKCALENSTKLQTC